MHKRFTERFSFKISVILIIILLFSLSLNSLLNFFNFEKTYRELVSSRFYVTAKDLKNSIEYQLNLGLALPEMKNIQALTDELKKKDRTISAVEICDERGRILYDTEQKKIGASMSPRLLTEIRKHERAAQSKKGEEKATTVIDGEHAYIILPVMNSFEIMVGAIALAYPRSLIAGPVRSMQIFLLLLFLGTLLVFSGITFAAVQLISRHLRERMTAMDSSLEALLSGGRDTLELTEHYGMEKDFTEFKTTATQALGDIGDLDARIDAAGKGAGRGKKK